MDAIRTALRISLLASCSIVALPSAEGQMFPGPSPSPSTSLTRVRSENFIVAAANSTLADEVARAAEEQRRELAIYWLGKPLPNWPQPCPITVMAAPNMGAGGDTTFTMSHGTVGNWRMNVKGSQERILDSVLPHEITHTVLATHFAVLGRPVPRWADEGACTTVEHSSEKRKHDHFLIQFLSQGRGLPFATMFSLKDYPSDIMPLYAQGYSVSCFLIAQGGPRRFVQFLEDGMRTENWVESIDLHYGYPKLGKLQSAWNQWVGEGGGSVVNHTADALGLSSRSIAARNSIASQNPVTLASAAQPITVGNLNPTGESWYKRQLGSNAARSDEVALTSTPTDAASNSSQPMISTTLPNAVTGTAIGNQPGTAMGAPGRPDYSVSHPQELQNFGNAPSANWAIGPSMPLYR